MCPLSGSKKARIRPLPLAQKEPQPSSSCNSCRAPCTCQAVLQTVACMPFISSKIRHGRIRLAPAVAGGAEDAAARPRFLLSTAS